MSIKILLTAVTNDKGVVFTSKKRASRSQGGVFYSLVLVRQTRSCIRQTRSCIRQTSPYSEVARPELGVLGLMRAVYSLIAFVSRAPCTSLAGISRLTEDA